MLRADYFEGKVKMSESRNSLFATAVALATGIALVGCSPSKDGEKLPPPQSQVGKANFNIGTGFLPYPIDLFFAPSPAVPPAVPVSDGTLNLPALSFRPASMRAALNSLDGWSTSAALDTSFSLPLDSGSISPNSVRIIKLFLDPRNKAPANPADPLQAAAFLPTGATSPVAGILAFGTDFTADVSDDFDSGGTRLRITPLKPWEASRGPAVNNADPATAGKIFNIGYLVILTNGLKAAGGPAMTPDTLYADIKAAPADCSTFTDPTQNAVCQLTKAHLGIATATGTSLDTIILTWSFSTQATTDTMNVVTALAAGENAANPNRTLVVPAFNPALGRILTTNDANAGLQGKADIYLGRTVLPYYLTPAADAADRTSVLSKFWTAAGPPSGVSDVDSRNLTMFNPTPAKVADVTVPLLLTVPNANSACAARPASGWPVAIVQHTIAGDRSQALAMADAFADQCYIVASIDLPLHGITAVPSTDPDVPSDPLAAFHCFAPPAPANPACLGAVERTFDVDLVNNANTTVAIPDGIIDSTGTHFINLSSPLTGRDNLRQGAADLVMFAKSVKTLIVAQAAPGSLPAGPVGVNAARVSFVGLSLGAIVGGTGVKFAAADLHTATLSAAGGVMSKLLNDSATFGPRISSAVNGQGLAPGSYLYNLYFRDFQAAIDSGDPINHIRDTQARVPTHLIKVLDDAVVPNNSTDRLITAGGLTKLTVPGVNPVAAGSGAWSFFQVGSHATLFDPTASLSATMEMQSQAVGFTASSELFGQTAVPVGLVDTDVLDLQ
jgi:hypothetical protein